MQLEDTHQDTRQRAIQAYNGLRNQTLPSEPILNKQLPVSTNNAKKQRGFPMDTT